MVWRTTTRCVAAIAVVVASVSPVHSTRSSRIVAAVGADPVDEPVDAIDRAATALLPAVRLRVPTSIVVVGDSLSWIGEGSFNTDGRTVSGALHGVGWDSVSVAALVSRSIIYPTDPQYSGLHTVRDLVAAGVQTEAWLIELGTNEMYTMNHCWCTDLAAFETDRIRQLLAEIPEGDIVYWVDPQHFGYPNLIATFDQVTSALVASGELAGVVRWNVVSSAHPPGWFVDDAHLRPDGYAAWFDAIAAVVVPPS